MEYIESVQVIFPDEQFIEYLNIRMWPKAFKKYIEVRKAELLSQKDLLYQEMNRETDEIFIKIEDFKETMQRVLQQGLVSSDADFLSYESKAPTPQLDFPESRASGSRLDNQSQRSINEESKKNAERLTPKIDNNYLSKSKTFMWLAKEIGMDTMRFDPYFIDSVFVKIEDLKFSFD